MEESGDWLGGGIRSHIHVCTCEGDNYKVVERGDTRDSGGKHDGVIERQQLYVRSYSTCTNRSVDTVPPICHCRFRE